MDFLYVKEEFDDIAVLHNIFFAFALHKTFLFCGVPGTESDKVVIFNDFGTDKAFFKVGMDSAGSFGSFGAFFNGPCANFFLTCGKIAHKAEKVIACFDHTVKTGFLKIDFGKEFFLFVRFHVGNLFFEFCADGHYSGVFGFCDLFNKFIVFVVFNAFDKVVFAHVCGIDDGFVGKKGKSAYDFFFFFVTNESSCGFAFFKMCFKLFEKCKFVGKAAVAFKVFFNSCDSSVKDFDIGEDEFKVDNFNVAACVDAAVNMDYVVVVKAADNVDKSVNFADVCKEFIAKTFAFCGAFNKTCDVNKFNGCGGVLFRLVNFR